MSDDQPDPFVDLVQRATAIERLVDGLGDSTYQLVERYVSSDDRLRLINETHEGIVTACSGLHALVRVVEEARSLSRHLIVAPAPDMDPSEPSRVPCAEGEEAGATMGDTP